MAESPHDDEAAFAVEHPPSTAMALEAFFDHVELDWAPMEGEAEEEKDLEWPSNKDMLPTLDTMGTWMGEEPSQEAVGPGIKQEQEWPILMAESSYDDEAIAAGEHPLDTAITLAASFDHVELDWAPMKGEVEEEKELDWLSNFPPLDTMGTWMGEEPSQDAVGLGINQVQSQQQEVVKSFPLMLTTMKVEEAAEDKGNSMVTWLRKAQPQVTVGPRTKGLRRRQLEMGQNLQPMLPVVEQSQATEDAHSQWRCRHCGAEERSQCYVGLEGPRMLCNTCGVRYTIGCLRPEYRPVDSPTFSLEMHSNCHRRIIDMRCLKDSGTTAASSRSARAEIRQKRMSSNATPATISSIGSNVPIASALVIQLPKKRGRPKKSGDAISSTTASDASSAAVVSRPGNATTGLDWAPVEGVVEEEVELKWKSNKDDFPTLDNIETWIGEEPSQVANRPGTEKVQCQGQGVVRSPPPMLPAIYVEEVAEDKVNTMVTWLRKAQPPVTVGPRSRRIRRQRLEVAWNLQPMLLVVEQPGAVEDAHSQRQCRHCGAVETPQWRVGPEGPRTLCNACGMRYRIGRLLPEYRPMNSPTFSLGMHSSSHRRVIEMRCLKDAGTTATSNRFTHAEIGQKRVSTNTTPATISSIGSNAPIASASVTQPPEKRGRPKKSRAITSNAIAVNASSAVVESSAGNATTELDWAPMEGKVEEKVDLESLSNKDVFPTQDTMGTWIGEEPSQMVVGPGTKKMQCQGQGVVRSLPSMLPAIYVEEAAEDKVNTMVTWLREAQGPATSGPRSKRVRRRRLEVAWNLQPVLPAVEQPGLLEDAYLQQRCRHCGAEETPQWRGGPVGPRTLCNACGVRYRIGRLLPEYRPKNSPTFSLGMHSDSHRRFIEMCCLKDAGTAATSSRFARAEIGKKRVSTNATPATISSVGCNAPIACTSVTQPPKKRGRPSATAADASSTAVASDVGNAVTVSAKRKKRAII